MRNLQICYWASTVAAIVLFTIGYLLPRHWWWERFHILVVAWSAWGNAMYTIYQAKRYIKENY